MKNQVLAPCCQSKRNAPRASAVILAMLCISVSVERAAAQISASWTQYQADAAHTGHVAGQVGASVPTAIWNSTATGLGEASLGQGAVTDNKHVYLTAYNHSSNGFSYYDIVALDRLTGSEAWARQVASYAGSVSPPSVGDSMVYIHQWGHSGISGGNAAQYPYVTGINSNTGSIVFATSHSGQWSSGSRPTVAGNQVFAAGGYYGGLDAYDAVGGGHLWFSNVNQQYGWIPAADSQRVYVYMGPASASPGPPVGTLYAFNRTGGALDYTILDPADTFTRYNGTVAIGTQNDAITLTSAGLVSFNLAAHTVRWQTSGNFTGALAIDGGSVYAANGIELDALDELTGSKLRSWFAPAGIALSGNLLVADDAIIVGTTGGTYAINRATFDTLWSLPISGDLALGNNTLLISTSSGLSAYAVPEPSGISLVFAAAMGWIAFRAIHCAATRPDGIWPFRIQ